MPLTMIGVYPGVSAITNLCVVTGSIADFIHAMSDSRKSCRKVRRFKGRDSHDFKLAVNPPGSTDAPAARRALI